MFCAFVDVYENYFHLDLVYVYHKSFLDDVLNEMYLFDDDDDDDDADVDSDASCRAIC